MTSGRIFGVIADVYPDFMLYTSLNILFIYYTNCTNCTNYIPLSLLYPPPAFQVYISARGSSSNLYTYSKAISVANATAESAKAIKKRLTEGD